MYMLHASLFSVIGNSSALSLITHFALVASSTMASISNPHADESTRVVAAVAAVTSVAALTVGARLYVRAFMIRSFGWDVG